MLTIGLTGNIGSGKTTVSDIFRGLGIPVFNADSESKRILSDESILDIVRKIFGDKVVNQGKTVNTKALAKVVFDDPHALKMLNDLLHPLVLQAFLKWKNIQSSPYVIMEAAIIFESGIRYLFDKIIHVACPKEIAINRVVIRDHVDGDEVLHRMEFQMSDHEKGNCSDFIINNDGQHLLIPQVVFIHEKFLEISAERHDQISAGAADA
jgi:dephospho-CoA kinase